MAFSQEPKEETWTADEESMQRAANAGTRADRQDSTGAGEKDSSSSQVHM